MPRSWGDPCESPDSRPANAGSAFEELRGVPATYPEMGWVGNRKVQAGNDSSQQAQEAVELVTLKSVTINNPASAGIGEETMKCFLMRIASAFSLAAACLPVYGQHIVSLPRSIADSGVTVQAMVPVMPQRITYCEGPALDRNGNLYFSEQSAGIIWKVTPAGVVSKWRTNTPAYSNGLEFGPDGYLYCCERTRITKVDTTGNVLKVITSGASFGDINDLSITSTGAMFFTNFGQSFWYHSSDSTINRVYMYASPSGLNFNGIEYIEEKGIMYVCMWGYDQVVTYHTGANGVVDTSTKKTFAIVNGPDGLTLDANYNVYIASNSGSTGSIIVYDSSGNQLGSIAMRQDNSPSGNASNCVFGGQDNKTLYITGDSGAYKIQLKVPGRVKPGYSSLQQNPKRDSRLTLATMQPAAQLVLPGNHINHALSADLVDQAASYSLLGQLIPIIGINNDAMPQPGGASFTARVVQNRGR